MSEYQLTPKQIQLCNYLLSINHSIIDRDKLKIDGHDESDIFNVQKFLLDKNLITNANPIRLTDKGVKYSKTGIVKFFKDQRHERVFKFRNCQDFCRLDRNNHFTIHWR